jgi:excisionase family DNA binding protein
MPELTMSVEEAASALGLSRSLTYQAVQSGEIPSVRVGRRILISRLALDQMLSGAQTSGGAA